MAYTKNFCQPVRMESQFVATKLHHTMVQDGSNNDIEVLDGTLVTITPGKFVQDAVYGDRYTDAGATAPAGIQLRVAVPTTTAAVEDVCIIDLATIPTKSGQGVVIRDGNMTIGLVNPAGVQSRARMLCKYDTFAIGEANCTGALTVGQYAVPAADGKFAPSASAVTTGFCAAVVDKYIISQGVDGDVTNGMGVQAYRLDVANTTIKSATP